MSLVSVCLASASLDGCVRLLLQELRSVLMVLPKCVWVLCSTLLLVLDFYCVVIMLVVVLRVRVTRW